VIITTQEEGYKSLATVWTTSKP